MTQPDSTVTSSYDKQISRRRIVRGAAWTVPVIAASVAAPALAASPTCPEGTPDLGTQSGWVAEVVNPEQFIERPNDDGHGWWASNPRRYYWVADNVSTEPADLAVMTLTKQIPVVAGTTYSFTYGVWSAYESGRATSWLAASFGDQRITDQSDAANVPQNPPGGPADAAERTITYTATTTGTIPFTFTFMAGWRGDAGLNQDFHIIFPEDATTCLPA
jgi:hypothetical protein